MQNIQHGEFWSDSFDSENISMERREFVQRVQRLTDYLSTKQLDETEIAATVVNYEQSAQNVRDRWELYRYADSYVDVQAVALEALAVPSNGVMLDVGTADGKYLHDIATVYGRDDIELLGIELMGAQLDHSNYWERISGNYFGIKDLAYNKIAYLMTGSAADLHEIPDGSLDAVSAMFMMYHLHSADRAAMLEECARTLKPNGRLVVTTSGISNKTLHRMHERLIARYMTQPSTGVFAPPRAMNTDFVSESAAIEMRNFRTVFNYEYHDHITLDRPEALSAYELSLKSMYDQFHPLPPRKLFNSAVGAVMFDIEQAAERGRPYRETIQRQILVCSKAPMPAKTLPENFSRLHFGAKREL